MTGKIPYGKGRRGGAYLSIRPGDELGLTVTGSTIEQSKFTDSDGQQRQDVVLLVVNVDGDDHKWRLNVGANLALDEAGVEVGDQIVVQRGADEVVDGRTQSQWNVEIVGGER